MGVRSLGSLRTQEAAHQNRHYDRREHQKDPTPSRSLREMELLEPDLIEIIGCGIGARSRTSSRQHENHVEDLRGVEKAEGDGKQNGWNQMWQCHIVERLPARGAVELGRLIELRSDRRQTREKDHKYERRPLPDVSADDRSEIPRG